ncbi:hypothetical protein [Gemmatimonas sp.]|jgi:hypothetical protein|uniref:hypothetical protein n=1 Tax=Gemmatimonas sp. TaxID=1962908 RepID=UPI003919119F
MSTSFRTISAGALACALAFTVAVLPACNASDAPVSDSVAAEGQSSATGHMAAGASAQGTWQDGDETVAWASQVERSAIAEISEHVTFGTDGKAERVLHFTQDGALSGYRETRTQTVQQPDRSPAPMTVQISMAFAGDSLTAQRKTVDSAEVPIRPYEIDNIRRHARAIFDHVRTKTPAQR